MGLAHGRSILLLDSNEQSAQDIQRFLKVSAFAFTVSHAAGIEEAQNYLKNHGPDLVLLDANFAGLPDYKAVRKVLEGSKVPTILLSETGGAELKRQAERAGAHDSLLKNKVNLFSLQKIIVNALKLNETESRLDSAVEEYSARQETFSKILNQVGEGVMVIDRESRIRFANDKAYKIMGDEAIRRQVSDFLLYRQTEAEETIEFKGKGKYHIEVRISPLDWQGEQANLVILEQHKVLVAEQETVRLNEMLQVVLNGINASIILLKEERIVFANKQACADLLFKPGNLHGRQLSTVLGSDVELFNSSSLKDFMTEKEAAGYVKAADGSTRPVRFVMRYLTLDDELYRVLSYTIQSLAPESEAPKAIAPKDRFSTDDVLHLASHDLREPVRTILNYVQLIADQLAKEKYEQAAEYAGFAKDAASRMDKLLSDLKVYIALSDYAFTMTKVSMKTLVADVLKTLKPVIEEKKAQITVTNLPDISADRELVEKLVFHLVDNAIRFCRKDHPVVDIGFDKYDGAVVFCIRDNGIGISKKYHTKVFELFERLNRVDEFPGNGLGLAISKKIVELHGGKIWVESLPGAGSSFYFTLTSK